MHYTKRGANNFTFSKTRYGRTNQYSYQYYKWKSKPPSLKVLNWNKSKFKSPMNEVFTSCNGKNHLVTSKNIWIRSVLPVCYHFNFWGLLFMVPLFSIFTSFLFSILIRAQTVQQYSKDRHYSTIQFEYAKIDRNFYLKLHENSNLTIEKLV